MRDGLAAYTCSFVVPEPPCKQFHYAVGPARPAESYGCSTICLCPPGTVNDSSKDRALSEPPLVLNVLLPVSSHLYRRHARASGIIWFD